MRRIPSVSGLFFSFHPAKKRTFFIPRRSRDTRATLERSRTDRPRRESPRSDKEFPTLRRTRCSRSVHALRARRNFPLFPLFESERARFRVAAPINHRRRIFEKTSPEHRRGTLFAGFRPAPRTSFLLFS